MKWDPFLQRCFDKLSEERMRAIGAGFELGMELGTDHEGMIFYFHNFHQFAIGRNAGENKSFAFELFFEGVVEFVAVTMTLLNQFRFVGMVSVRVF